MFGGSKTLVLPALEVEEQLVSSGIVPLTLPELCRMRRTLIRAFLINDCEISSPQPCSVHFGALSFNLGMSQARRLL